jgi:uncharacterized MAPEG superfamily protein
VTPRAASLTPARGACHASRNTAPGHAPKGEHMTTDLTMLIWTALLALLAPTVYLAGRMQTPGGMAWALGNREGPLRIPEWAARAERAHANLVENIGPFAILVLVAHVSGHANATTALGATIFFWSRVAHFAVYTAGVIGVRTAVFFAGAAGELLILSQLFG